MRGTATQPSAGGSETTVGCGAGAAVTHFSGCAVPALSVLEETLEPRREPSRPGNEVTATREHRVLRQQHRGEPLGHGLEGRVVLAGDDEDWDACSDDRVEIGGGFAGGARPTQQAHDARETGREGDLAGHGLGVRIPSTVLCAEGRERIAQPLPRSLRLGERVRQRQGKPLHGGAIRRYPQ
jgi:hypothetical protein